MSTETYGEQVRRLRKERRLTQDALAELTKVPVRTLQDIEADKSRNPHRGNRLALNRELGIVGCEDTERAAWPDDVRVILDILGAFLVIQTPDERLDWLRSVMPTVVGGPQQ